MIVSFLFLSVFLSNALASKIDITYDKSSFFYTNSGEKGYWYEVQKIFSSDCGKNDYFGCSVDIDGSYAVVGAKYDSTGSAYVFYDNNGTWIQQAKLIPSDGEVDDYFGCSVSIFDKKIIVGAYGKDESEEDCGAAYIFKEDNGSWIQEKKLTNQSLEKYDCFGYSVSIFKNYAIVGAIGDDENGTNVGAAYVFKYENNTWYNQVKLMPRHLYHIKNANFGYSVSISNDTVLVGSNKYNSYPEEAGAAFIYSNSDDSWKLISKIESLDPRPYYHFGTSVKVNYENVMVGSTGYNDVINNREVGCVHSLIYKDTNNLLDKKIILANDLGNYDYFGCSIDIFQNFSVIGAKGKDNFAKNSGSAYIFFKDDDCWIQDAKLSASDGEIDDYFGCSVSISDDFVLVGAEGNDENGLDSGAAYLFTVKKNNSKPSIPNKPAGFNFGRTNVCYEFTTKTVDPDEDKVYYLFDWGDQSESVWLGPYNSNQLCIANHSWKHQGLYNIRVKSKDIYGAESEWSENIKIFIPIKHSPKVKSNLLSFYNFKNILLKTFNIYNGKIY